MDPKGDFQCVGKLDTPNNPEAIRQTSGSLRQRIGFRHGLKLLYNQDDLGGKDHWDVRMIQKLSDDTLGLQRLVFLLLDIEL